MKKIGHNNPPIPLDPKETIKKNISRRKLIVDQDIDVFEGLPLPTWIELSLIDVCNRSCSFCPKADETIAPDTYMKMNRTLVDKLYNDLKKMIDLNKSELFILSCLGIPTLFFGFYPDPLINTIEVSISDLIEMYNYKLVSKF